MSVALEGFWRRLANTRLRDAVRGRLDGRLDWRSQIESAELPSGITACVHNVVRKSRLWKRERVDVTEELIAHFRDGIDARADAGSLVEDFGDAKTAARLIRRAKLRCRPLWWQAWWWASRSFAGLLLVYFLMFLWMLPGRPNVAVDYVAVLNEKASAAAPEERAWPAFREAFMSLGPAREELRDAQGGVPPGSSTWQGVIGFWGDAEPASLHADAELSFPNPPVDPAEPKAAPFGNEYVDEGPQPTWDDAKAWLAEHEGFVNQIREASGRPYLGFETGFHHTYSPADRRLFGVSEEQAIPPTDEDGEVAPGFVIGVFLEHLTPMRHLARAMAADALLQADAGSGDLVVADLKAAIAIGRYAGEHPVLVSGLVRNACNFVAVAALREVLAARPDALSDAQLVELAHAFAAIPTSSDYWYRGEESFFKDFLQRVYTDDGDGDGRMTGEGYLLLTSLTESQAPYSSKWADPALWLLMPTRAQMRAKHEELWAYGMAEIKTPLWERANPGYVSLDQRIDSLGDSAVDKLRYQSLHLLFPSVFAADAAFEKHAGLIDGALTGIALELYRRDSGGWPERLEELTPRWLPEVPTDRINGGSVQYRVDSDRPVVYSRGVDTDDDGGQLPADCGGSLTRYRVSLPELNSVAAGESDVPDGDWVIWRLR